MNPSDERTTTTTPSLTYLRPEVAELKRLVDDFVENDCIPAEASYEDHLSNRHGADRWTMEAVPPCMEILKRKARELGLWNMFLPPHLVATGNVPTHLQPTVPLSYREYGIICESLGRSPNIAPEACNTSAPDTGNMEVLIEFGNEKQQRQYLIPLLEGTIRSTFLMTEPAVASSDPTNLEATLTKIIVPSSNGSGGTVEYILNGRKWWSTGAMDPRCRLALVVAKMDYSQTRPNDDHHHNSSRNSSRNSANQNQSKQHGAHTIVAVPMPHPGVRVEQALTTFGYDDAPSGHAVVQLDNVRLTSSDLILGEGSGFRVSQARLGPGRIHHCMRAIGMAARAYELMLQRSLERRAFGKLLYQHANVQEQIADSVSDLEAARLLTLSCASSMDTNGVKASRHKIASIKVTVPQLTYNVVDRAVQVFGGAGVYRHDLARVLAGIRTLRIADGPDAVHKRTVASLEIRNAKAKLAKEGHQLGTNKPLAKSRSRL